MRKCNETNNRMYNLEWCTNSQNQIKMEELKKQILHLLEENTTEETSSTGTTGERIIYAPYNDIVEDIIKMVADNFEPKKCMPDEIKSKDEHGEEYYNETYENKENI